VLTTAIRVLARRWPALLAWFLVGFTVRALILRGGGYLLNIDENLGLLVLPLAILGMLAAYVGMFLVVRAELSHLRADALPGDDVERPFRLWRDSLLSAILPFFLLYVAWNLIRDDVIDLYFASTLQQNFLDQTTAETLAPVSLAILVAAFGIRWLLGRFATRLPRWTTLVAAYFEAVWVLVALFTIKGLLDVAFEWLATRRMFAWAVDGWAAVRESFAWLGTVGDAVGWVIAQVGTVVGLPLAWLAFASIVYVGTMPRPARTATAGAQAMSARWQRLPSWMRALGRAVTSGFLDRWRPVALAARLIWAAGPVALGGYVLAFGVITAGGEWLRLVLYRLAGPHPVGWWYGASDGFDLIVDAVVAVLQVALVAAAFDAALRGDRVVGSGGPTPAAAPAAETAADEVSAAAAPRAGAATS
jgi:hypothetical protein